MGDKVQNDANVLSVMNNLKENIIHLKTIHISTEKTRKNPLGLYTRNRRWNNVKKSVRNK